MWLEIVIVLIIWVLLVIAVIKLIQQYQLNKLLKNYKPQDDKGKPGRIIDGGTDKGNSDGEPTPPELTKLIKRELLSPPLD